MNKKAVASYLKLAAKDFEIDGDTTHLMYALETIRELIIEENQSEKLEGRSKKPRQ